MLGYQVEGVVDMRCAIRVKGYLMEQVKDWIADLSFRQETDGTTELTGSVADQAELLGILRRINDLGVRMISIHMEEE